MRTDFQQVLQLSGSVASIAGHGTARAVQNRAAAFTNALAQASAAPSRQGSDLRQVAGAGRSQVAASAQAAQLPDLISTPFGSFDRNAVSRPVVNVKAASETEAFFMTHAPGEWWQDPFTRAVFAKTYGDQALAILDSTCTVPANMDPTWVTRPRTNNPRPT